MKQRNDTFTVLRSPRPWKLHVERYARENKVSVSEAIRRLVVLALADRDDAPAERKAA